MRIDAHQHYWEPGRGDYGWMPKDNAILNRAYAPRDMVPLLDKHQIDATVLVQAAPTVAETEYMLGLADGSDRVAGVVGWINFEDPGQRATLERLADHPKFKGVRPMIQDIPDDDWMLRADVQWGYQALCDLDLSFDALGFPRHLDNFLTLLARFPQMRVVVDHCMKPQIHAHAPESFSHWADGMARIAATGAYCKLSGLVTEAGADWTTDDLRPYADHVLKVFGPERTMWGSDWPVCRLAAEYDQWLETAETLTAGLTGAQKIRVFGGTAAEFYRIAPPT